jgi:hypothetical protein
MHLNHNDSIDKFNRYHHSYTFKHVEHINEFSHWFKSKVDANEWNLFTCTVVFKPVDKNNTQTRFEDEYKNRFLQKIRRRLERSPIHQPKTIPYENLYYFEREHKTVLRSISKKSPFHIHSIIPVRTNQVHRFWDYDNNRLHPRLFKDLNSIDVVQDVLIEPVRSNHPFAWLMYSTKQKEL